MRAIRWLDRKLAGGIYAGPARHFIRWSYERLSLNLCFHRFVARRLALGPSDSRPAWVSEFYQIGALVLGVVLVVLCRYLPPPWRWLFGVLALYRPLEILLFSIRWVFMQTAPVLARKRSLVGFLISLAEVVVAFGAAHLAFGCVVVGIPTALYSSLRTLVTIGPLKTAEPPIAPGCGALIAGEILVGYLLTVIIVASLVGTIRPRPERGGPTTG